MATVEINNGVLWIDSEAYPLRNISRVGSRWLDPRPLKSAAIKKFVLRTLLCLFITVAVSQGSGLAATFVFLAGMALLIWRLSVVMKLQPVYGLVLNTSGVQEDAIWSLSQKEINTLVGTITDAIGHPDTAQQIINLNHVVSGDIVQMFGDENTGKQVAGARR